MYTKDFHSLTVNEALYELEQAIKTARRDKDKVLCLIVGYGSSGRTHKIKTAFLELLDTKAKNNLIKAYIAGENLDMFSKEYLSFKYLDRIPLEAKRKHNRGEIYVIL